MKLAISVNNPLQSVLTKSVGSISMAVLMATHQNVCQQIFIEPVCVLNDRASRIYIVGCKSTLVFFSLFMCRIFFFFGANTFRLTYLFTCLIIRRLKDQSFLNAFFC